MKRMAEQLESENPWWIVLYGVSSREFVAFPRFKVPKGTVLAACHPGALPPRMRQIEGAVGLAAAGGASEADPGDGNAAARLAG
jgi:hypothetical protein